MKANATLSCHVCQSFKLRSFFVNTFTSKIKYIKIEIKIIYEKKLIPVNTCDTMVWVRSVLRYAKVQHRTRTHGTRFGNTAGKPVPVQNPRYSGAAISIFLLT